jgi:hypothetical protein
LIFILNYLVFFLDPYYPANHIAGMVAAVHTAPGVGAAMWLAAAMMAIVIGFGLVRLRWIGLAVVLIYLSALGSWGEVIRQEYVRSWTNQKAFWKQITSMVPDAIDGSVIIVQIEQPMDLPYTWIIGSNSWADAVVPRMLYEGSWKNAPAVYVFTPSWMNMLQARNGQVGWIRPASVDPPAWQTLEPGKLVVIHAKDGVLRRLHGTLGTPAGDVTLSGGPPAGSQPRLRQGIVRSAILN